MTCCTCKLQVALLLLGAIFVAAGIVALVVVPGIIQNVVKNEVAMTNPDSTSFDSFVNSSGKVDIFQTYYFYHLTNPYAVEYQNAVPELVQKGPYVYLTTQWRDLDNISWRSNATVEYTYHETYTFRPDLSNGLLESDALTTVDLGAVGAMYKTGGNIIEIDILKLLAKSLFVNTTVGGLLWGYNNTFLEELHAFDASVSPFLSIQTNDDPSTFSAPSAAYTGGKAYDKGPQPPENSYMMMTRWEGMDELPYWNSTYANMINGTDGTCFYPGIKKTDTPPVFVDSLYRSVTMVCQESTSYMDVDLYRFVLAQKDTLNGTANPDNAAFYMTDTGFIPTPPQGNVPIVFSKPHFLDASLQNVNLTIDPAPIDRALYETLLDVEPTTGLLLRVHKRIQLNVFLHSYYALHGPIVNTWFPLFWGDENFEMSEHLVNELKTAVLLPQKAAFGGGIAAIALGGILIILAIVLLVRSCKRRSQYGDYDAVPPAVLMNSMHEQRLNSHQFGDYHR